jgi:ABC-type uncharacterized transport system substrate-binding protein
MGYGPDPVDTGVVSSLARPGGNITGLTSLSADLAVKRLELLNASTPGVSRVAFPTRWPSVAVRGSRRSH